MINRRALLTAGVALGALAAASKFSEAEKMSTTEAIDYMKRRLVESNTERLRHIVARVSPGGFGVLLVKPQFEAGRREVPRGGVVRSEETRRRVVEEIEAFGRELGLEILGSLESPIRGARGNAEFLVGFRVN